MGIKLLKILSAVVFILLCTAFFYIWHDQASLAEEIPVPPASAPSNGNVNLSNELRIGIIGESTASRQSLDPYLIEFLESTGKNIKVISRGHSGATAKQIYLDLFKPTGEGFSTHHILMDDQLDFCIVLTGINDSAGHYSAKFYAHHLELIVRSLLVRGIVPVVVEIPEYQSNAYEYKHWHLRIRSWLMRWMSNGTEHDILNQYRAVALARLNPLIVSNKMIYVDFHSIVSNINQNQDLYRDLIHLNNKGNQKLAYVIAMLIQQWLLEEDQLVKGHPIQIL